MTYEYVHFKTKKWRQAYGVLVLMDNTNAGLGIVVDVRDKYRIIKTKTSDRYKD